MVFCYFVSTSILQAGQVGEELQDLSRGRKIKQGVKQKIEVGPFASPLSIIHKGNHKLL